MRELALFYAGMLCGLVLGYSWAVRRRVALQYAFGIADLLHLIGFPSAASYWLNHAPGEWLVRFGYSKRIRQMESGCHRYRWDTVTNTVTNVGGDVEDTP